MPADSAVMQHCATCPECARVTARLREIEYDAATVLNNLPPISDPLTVAESSATIDRRRRVGRVVVTLSGIAGAIIIGLVSSTMILPTFFGDRDPDRSPTSHLRTETIPLSCLSPEQAADIITPYVRARGSMYHPGTAGLSVITVTGTPEELAKSRDLIREFESDPRAACRYTLADKIREIQDQVIKAQESRGGPEPVVAPTGPRK